MRSPISRKFALAFMIIGLAILCSRCINDTASRAAITNTSIKSKQGPITPTPHIRIDEHPMARQARHELTQRILPAASQQPTIVAPSHTHQPLKLILACSGPAARDGFSITSTHARACVYATPGATLTISAHFCGGKADPSSVLQRDAIVGTTGFYEWNWTPAVACSRGYIWDWQVKVTAQMQQTSASVSEVSSTPSSIATSSSSSSASSNP
jgi:hypothetical protein